MSSEEIKFSMDIIGEDGEWIEEEFCTKDVEKFLDAIGEDKELLKQFLNTRVLPPTFLTIFRKGRPDPNIQGFKTFLHAEQEYEIFSTPKSNKVRYRTRIENIYKKQSKKTGKDMIFVVFETEFFSEGEIFAKGKSTLVFL